MPVLFRLLCLAAGSLVNAHSLSKAAIPGVNHGNAHQDSGVTSVVFRPDGLLLKEQEGAGSSQSVVRHGDGGVQTEDSTTVEGLMRAWAEQHPPLLKPYFWFWGRIAEIDTSSSLLTVEDARGIQFQTPSNKRQTLKRGLHLTSYAQHNQDLLLMPILKQIDRGFFVESGARDGEADSNTLLYELKLGWKGLLIEPDILEFKLIKTKNRHAYAYNGCLSPHGKQENLHFFADKGLGHISKDGYLKVQAEPLHSLMHALGRTTVDFWSLDIEGSESDVLHGTDFSKVEVGVLLVEMNKSHKNNRGIREVMKKNGFNEIGTSYTRPGHLLDHVFINPQYFLKRNMDVPTSLESNPGYLSQFNHWICSMSPLSGLCT